MEDLGLSDSGRAIFDILDGKYDRGGAIPCQTDGGLKCFGHPVGASGLRMAYEVYNQLRGRAGDRQLAQVDFGLTHNLGGAPFNRSEEHTSELQSLMRISYAVFCLKKKKKKTTRRS